jgi:hypothetical protein
MVNRLFFAIQSLAMASNGWNRHVTPAGTGISSFGAYTAADWDKDY